MAPTICCISFFSLGDTAGVVYGESGSCESVLYLRGDVGNGECCEAMVAGWLYFFTILSRYPGIEMRRFRF